MRFPFRVEAATLLERPNRFLVHVSLRSSNERVYAHCPDPGRLLELLVPGATVHVSREAPGAYRSTAYTLRFVEHPVGGVLVSVVSRLANDLFREALAAGVFPALVRYTRVRAEVALPAAPAERVHSRVDYLLEGDGLRPCWVEVKSATLVDSGIAFFPDAITERGRRHLAHLRMLAAAGERCAVCFVVQRPDAYVLRPQWDRDPAFARELLLAKQSGVEFYACTTLVTLEEARVLEAIPVQPEPLEG